MTPKLFTETNTATELKKFLPVNINFNFKNIAPAMAMAERKYLVPVLGEAMFKKLVELRNNAESSETEKQAVEYAQYVVAKLAYFNAFDEISVMLDEKGATAPTENRLYKYQEDNLKRNLKETAFDTLDELIDLIDKNKNDFTEWNQSPWFERMNKLLVRSTKEYNKVFNINNSHLVFIKMIYYMEIVETTLLAHRIGGEFLKEIKQDMEKEEYKPFIEQLRKYVVFKSVAIGIEELGMIPTERGMMWESTTQTITNPKLEKQTDVTTTRRNCDRYAEAYIGEAIRYLNMHSEDFEKYHEYTAGKNPTTNRYTQRDNNRKIVMA